jgi:hypothetical protein
MSDRPAAAPAPEEHREPAFVGLLAALIVAVVVLHLPSFAAPHVEGDEVVFTYQPAAAGLRAVGAS